MWYTNLCQNRLTEKRRKTKELVKKFGDIPQVRTFIRLQRKYLSRKPLIIDEAIALLAADLYLYQHKSTEEHLKYLTKAKRNYKRVEERMSLNGVYWNNIVP